MAAKEGFRTISLVNADTSVRETRGITVRITDKMRLSRCWKFRGSLPFLLLRYGRRKTSRT